MQAGNVTYSSDADLPEAVAVFPLSGALLLPGGQMPLNIFEPRYLALIDDAMSGARVIGMIQPRLDGAVQESGEPELCAVGCFGRITSLTETGDGRYLLNLQGIARFRVLEELESDEPYRLCRVCTFTADLSPGEGEDVVDRDALLKAFRSYLEANQLEADWESVERAGNVMLVNSMAMMLPYGPAEKQALLEAPDLKTRADTLIAITEIVLARDFGTGETTLQ